MFKLLRNVIALIVLALMAYAATTYPLGDKTLLAHVMEVWRAPIVQKKIAQVERGARDRVSQYVSELESRALRERLREKGELLSPPDDDIIEKAIAGNLPPGSEVSEE